MRGSWLVAALFLAGCADGSSDADAGTGASPAGTAGQSEGPSQAGARLPPAPPEAIAFA